MPFRFVTSLKTNMMLLRYNHYMPESTVNNSTAETQDNKVQYFLSYDMLFARIPYKKKMLCYQRKLNYCINTQLVSVRVRGNNVRRLTHVILAESNSQLSFDIQHLMRNLKEVVALQQGMYSIVPPKLNGHRSLQYNDKIVV